jgi:hypothetical protein
MNTHSRQNIIILLSLLPTASPSTEPCNEANSDLWRIWCEMTGREDVTNSTVWTETDVTYSSIVIIARHLREITVADA